MSRERTTPDAPGEPLDLSALRRDEVLLDRIGAGARSTTSGAGRAESGHDPVERLLDAWVHETRRLEKPDPPTGRTEPTPGPHRVVEVRQALVGAAVLAGVLMGGSGVAAAVAGDPLAGFARLQQAVIAVASPDDQPPLLRSWDGASAQHQLERAREMLAAGDVGGAREVLEGVSALVSGLPDDEQALMRDDLSAAQLSASGGERAQPSGTLAEPGSGSQAGEDGSNDDRWADGSGGGRGQAPPSSADAPPSATAPTTPAAAPTTPATPPPTSQPTSPPTGGVSATSSHQRPVPPPSASGASTADPTQHGPPQDPPGNGTEKPERPSTTHSPTAS